MTTSGRAFRDAYAAQRAAEGHGAGGMAERLALPYLRTGPRAAQWAVRARTFDRFLARVFTPLARAAAPRALSVLDLGAGNGWLAYRIAQRGHHAVAIDVRTDEVDGLGAGATWDGRPAPFARAAASFDAIPLATASVDAVVFNAALHYALDLAAALTEAARVVRSGGRIVVLDTPFYRTVADGDAMVAAKRKGGAQMFGDRAEALLAPACIEYLTPRRLDAASRPLGLTWRRHRVRYPITYELRPVVAWLRRARRPSRFDVWEAVVP